MWRRTVGVTGKACTWPGAGPCKTSRACVTVPSCSVRHAIQRSREASSIAQPRSWAVSEPVSPAVINGRWRSARTSTPPGCSSRTPWAVRRSSCVPTPAGAVAAKVPSRAITPTTRSRSRSSGSAGPAIAFITNGRSVPPRRTITASFPPSLFEQVEQARGLVSRSAWLQRAAEEFLVGRGALGSRVPTARIEPTFKQPAIPRATPEDGFPPPTDEHQTTVDDMLASCPQCAGELESSMTSGTATIRYAAWIAAGSGSRPMTERDLTDEQFVDLAVALVERLRVRASP
jgi:hypothetical protein